MQKPRVVMSGRGLLLAACFGLLVVLLPLGALADEPAVVRLSFVQGSVQVTHGDESQIDNAVPNMPLFDDTVLTTGTDGRAEVEFADGSVARLTPNSSMQLKQLQRLGSSGHTELMMGGGLAYFELNVGQGQKFSVAAVGAVFRPLENSIFRVNLDGAPDVSVMQGSLHVDGHGEGQLTGGALGVEELNVNQSLRFDPNAPGRTTIAEEIAPDSWDQWNLDRDAQIAREAENQTEVRESSNAPGDPGWNDLDYYGSWYPVEGYGNVWTPNDVSAGWDPFGYGYWGNYPGYGPTWVSGYPWGWLPYHCGAWNYFPFGWGWVPGGCGLGWTPVVTVWNTPENYRLPVWPKGGFAIPSKERGVPVKIQLLAVDRGPAARGPWAGATGAQAGAPNGRMRAMHTQPIRVDGNTVQPIPAMPSNSLLQQRDRNPAFNAHVGIPAGRAGPVSGGSQAPPGDTLIRPNYGGSVAAPRGVVRPMYTAPPAVSRPAPAPAAPRAAPAAPAPAAPAPSLARPH